MTWLQDVVILVLTQVEAWKLSFRLISDVLQPVPLWCFRPTLSFRLEPLRSLLDSAGQISFIRLCHRTQHVHDRFA